MTETVDRRHGRSGEEGGERERGTYPEACGVGGVVVAASGGGGAARVLALLRRRPAVRQRRVLVRALQTRGGEKGQSAGDE